MRNVSTLACSLLALAIATPALAADIEAASKIGAVTVYPDAAIITRTAEVDLPAGANVVVFKGLPVSLDPASLRVEGEAAVVMTIGTVENETTPGAPVAPDNAIEAKLATLRADKEAAQATVDALSAKRAMIMRFSQSGPEKLSADAKPLDIGQWSAAWDAVAAGLATVGDALRPALARTRALDDQIKALEAERQTPIPGQGAQRSVHVTIVADAPTSARLTLSYRVGGVGWRPAYDADLGTKTAAKTLSLTRRALLAQRTGEDWSDVALTVSTARVARASDIPEVATLKIDFWQPAQVEYDLPAGAPSAAKMGMRAGAAAPADAVAESTVAPAPPPIPRVKAKEIVSQVESGAYSAEFKVPGRISLASDGAQKSFVLARLGVQPTILIKTAPGLDQTAYLQTHFVDAEEAPLLAGEVALHRDGAFVGLGRVAFVAPGDGLDLGFGADDKIKIQRTPVSKKENEPTWYNQTKVETRDFKTNVKNLHDFAVKVQLIDQLPVSENTSIAVDLLPATTPPTEKQVGDKRGVMSWTLDLAPGEAKDIRLAYRMRWPADRAVMLDGAPVDAGAQ